MEKICVIVPVYRVEPYLSRCIDSILGQSWQNLQLILVDDGSPDRCGEICDSYREQDGRVHVIHQTNGGAAAARNAGMELVRTDQLCQWVAFVDGDDWIHPDFLRALHDAAVKMECAISACGFYETNGANQDGDQVYDPVRMSAKAYFCGQIHGSVTYGPCNKLYHRSLFSCLLFPQGRCVEDEYVVFRALFSAGSISVLDNPLYAYFQRPDSFTRNVWTAKRLDAWDAFEEQLDYFQKMGDRELIHFRYRGYLDNAFLNWDEAKATLPEKDPVLKKMKKRIRWLIFRAWRDGCIEFWFDYENLQRFFPVLARVCRLFWERKKS